MVYPHFQVAPNFRVRVEDRGLPIRGLRVEIRSYGRPVYGDVAYVAHTDQNGFALFRGVRPESYHLSANRDAGIADGADLEVKSDGPTDVTVPLNWPRVEPVLVRSLKGSIRRPGYFPGQSQPVVSLDLLEAISGQRLKRLQTTNRGEFDFESAAPGLYFLSLRPVDLKDPSEQITGLIAVAIDREAPTDQLDLDLGWSSCGLWYADRSKCPQGDLYIEQLFGEVRDAAGAAIADAKILLFDPNETLIESLQSDSAGKFISSRSLAGTYKLVVSQAGFTPLRSTVHAKSTSGGTRHSPLTVRLGVFGNCSTAKHQ